MPPVAIGVIVFVLGLLGILGLMKRAQASPGAAAGGVSEPVPVAPTVASAKYPYEKEIRAAAERYKVDPDLVAAVIAWETRGDPFNPNATNPDDPSYGLGQVTPYIGVRFGVIASVADYRELYDPAKNTRAVAAFLAYLLNDKKYPLDMAIQMYNEGEPRYWEGGRVAGYLNGVLGYYKKYSGQKEIRL